MPTAGYERKDCAFIIGHFATLFPGTCSTVRCLLRGSQARPKKHNTDLPPETIGYHQENGLKQLTIKQAEETAQARTKFDN